jgi:hypothetical protein
MEFFKTVVRGRSVAAWGKKSVQKRFADSNKSLGR